MGFRRILVLLLLAGAGCSPSTEGRRGQIGESDLHIVGAGTESDVFEGAQNIVLAQAACLGDTEAVTAALQAGANPNASGREGMTPVRWALRCGSLSGMEELLRAGGDPVPGAVMDAARVGNADFLRVLLRAGADPNARDEEGPWSALRIAFSMGLQDKGWEGYYALLDAGANINTADPGGTIAEFAAALNQYDKVAELLDRGYSHDLNELGLYVQRVERAAMPPGQFEPAMRVRAMLEDRGVRFPVPPTDANLRPPAAPTNQ